MTSRKLVLCATAGLFGGLLFFMTPSMTAGAWPLASASSVPHIIIALSFGPRFGIVSGVISVALLYIASPSTPIFYLRQLVPGAVIFHSIRNDLDNISTISRAAISGTVVTVLGLTALGISDPDSLAWLDRTLQMGSENLSSGRASLVKPQVEAIIMSLIPSMFFMEGLASSLIALLLTRFILFRLGNISPLVRGFKLLKIEWPASWFLITGITGVWFLSPKDPAGAFFINILAASCIFFSIQGIAIGEYLMEKNNFTMGLKALLWLVILLTGLWPLMLMTGVMDTWFDIRRIREDEKREIS